MPIITPQKALHKLREYLDEIDKLSRMKYLEGINEKEKLNLKIKSFISFSFYNADQKLKEYDSNVNWFVYAVGIERTEQEEQDDYIYRLITMRNHLELYREELEMISDNYQIHGITDTIKKDSKEVFIIHGHDNSALLETERLLKERWDLKTIILKDRPGKGRTLIEKFEQEAKKASYAFAILTPDDMIKPTDGEYLQPRPNVVFELGWFYGTLGREKVCILYKKGAVIHSDLQGISQIQFDKSINEKVIEIENELKAGNLI